MNHEERFAVQERRIQTITQALEGIPHVKAESVWERRGPWIRLWVTLDEEALGKTAASVVQALRDGEPSIRVRRGGEPNQIGMSVHPLREGEDKIIAERLREILTS